MKVILTKDVSGVGRAGDIKEVSDGYARNFLIGRHLGMAATPAQIQKMDKEKREHSEKLARQHAKLLELQNKLSTKAVKLKKKASGDKLFAGVHEQDIINGIKAEFGVDLLPKQIKILNPIKTTGNHAVELKLTDKHKTTVTVNIQGL